MKIFCFFIFFTIPNLNYGQDTNQTKSDIFKTVVCDSYAHDNLNVFYVSALGIDKFEFYQDQPSYNDSYNLNQKKSNDKSALGGNVIDLSVSHNPIINYYNRNPYQTISQFNSIDTSEINRYLVTIKEYTSNTVNWPLIVYKCDNVKFFKRFHPRMIRRLINQKCTFVSNPIVFNKNKFAIIKVAKFRVSSSIKDLKTIIYFVENIENKWTIKDKFSVINTTTTNITEPSTGKSKNK